MLDLFVPSLPAAPTPSASTSTTSPDQTNAREDYRHRCEVTDWVRRIRNRQGPERADYWRHWRAEIAMRRGQEAARKLNDDVMAEMRR